MVQETRRCALLIKRHALSLFAAPAGLASTVQCCSLALLHDSAVLLPGATALQSPAGFPKPGLSFVSSD